MNWGSSNFKVLCSSENNVREFTGETITNDYIGKGEAWRGLAELLFCPQCHECKTYDQCQFSVESKACAGCFSIYEKKNVTECTKNCVICPICGSNLSIKATDDNSGDNKGKIFTMRCTYCSYTYKTDTVTKPAFLTKIIRQASDHENKGHIQFIDAVLKALEVEIEAVKKSKYGDNRNSEVATIVDPKILKTMGFSTTAGSSAEEYQNKLESLLPFNEKEDTKLVKTQMGKTSMYDYPTRDAIISQPYLVLRTGGYSGKEKPGSIPKVSDILPLAKKLHTRLSYRCDKCKSILALPDKNPFLTKYKIKWNASDILPTIALSGYNHDEYPKEITLDCLLNILLIIENQLSVPLHLTLATIPTLNGGFLSNHEALVQITLPIAKLILGGKETDSKDESSFIKSIPTPFLTEKTKISRTELALRLNFQTITAPKDIDSSFELYDSLYEGSRNWCVIPLNILLSRVPENVKELKILLPLHLSVESDLAGVNKFSGLYDSKLNYKYWTISDMGTFVVNSK